MTEQQAPPGKAGAAPPPPPPEGPIAALATAFELAGRAMLQLILGFVRGEMAYDEAEAGIDQISLALAEDSREWAEDELPEVYIHGIRQVADHDNTPDVDPDIFDEEVHRATLDISIDKLIADSAKGIQNISENAKTSLREAARERLAASLDEGTNARKESRRLAAELEEIGRREDATDDEGTVVFTDSRNRDWQPRAYAEMLLRTHTIEVTNQANLIASAELGVPGVAVFDGGPTDTDLPCIIANGQRWSLRYARRHRTEHPNCRRAFAPLPSTFPEDDLDKAEADEPSPSDDAKLQQEREREEERREAFAEEQREKERIREEARREMEAEQEAEEGPTDRELEIEEALRLIEEEEAEVEAERAAVRMEPDEIMVAGVEDPVAERDLQERSSGAFNFLAERYPDLSNRWASIVEVKPDDEMGTAYAWKDGDCFIAMSQSAENRITDRYETLLHEMFHAISPRSDASSTFYKMNPGWEEAVVEMQNRLNIRDFLIYMGSHHPEGSYGAELLLSEEDADHMVELLKSGRFKRHPYNHFIVALEDVRDELEMEPKDFYDQLIRVDQTERRAYLQELIMEKFPEAGSEQSFALDLLGDATRRMVRRGE